MPRCMIIDRVSANVLYRNKVVFVSDETGCKIQPCIAPWSLLPVPLTSSAHRIQSNGKGTCSITTVTLHHGYTAQYRM
jgi:hypothetical protein